MVRMLPTRSSSSARLKQFIVDLTILILIGNLERCSSSGNEIRELEKPLFLDKVVEGLKKLKEEWISPPDKGTINFLLFHPSKSKDNQWETIATGNSSTINTKNLQAGKPFKIAIHGFLSSCKTSNDSDFPEGIFQAYASQKKAQNYNFICVDWAILANPGKITQIASLFHYPKAVNSTLCVGDATEHFIQGLITQGALKDQDIIDVHIIGHSLGAHIGGVAGHEFIEKSKKKKKIARISGLDPAGPAFYEKGKSDKCKLGTSDAAFVDVLHTNMGQLGTKELLGHANFILNGGVFQPFCKKENVLENIAEKLSGVCSHASSNSIFVKSIKKTTTGCRCKNWQAFTKVNGTCKTSETAVLGDKVSLKARGTFCLHMKSI